MQVSICITKLSVVQTVFTSSFLMQTLKKLYRQGDMFVDL